MMYRSMVRLIAVVFSLMTATFGYAANQASVDFDVDRTIAFTESSTSEFARAHPFEKTVRAQVAVSMFVPPAVEVTHALYHFHFVEGDQRVINYAPRTRVATNIVGEIDVTKNSEQGRHNSLSGAAQFDHWISADASASNNESTGINTRYKMLPPIESVLAAGTSNRGQGVYFKLQKSTTETLEGEQRVEIEIRVPRDWRGGYMRLIAQASNKKRALPASSYLVPVYLQGDEEARAVAHQLRTFERQFVAAATRHAKAVHRAGRPTIAHELSLVAPEIPKDWRQQVLWRPSVALKPSFVDTLPQRVRVAASNYHTAKRLAVAMGTPRRREVAKPIAELAVDSKISTTVGNNNSQVEEIQQMPSTQNEGWQPRATSR